MGRSGATQATEVRSKQTTVPPVNAQQSLAVCKNLLRVAVGQVCGGKVHISEVP
jgi:hypothetical protein